MKQIHHIAIVVDSDGRSGLHSAYGRPLAHVEGPRR